jgi:hypothetical protein
VGAEGRDSYAELFGRFQNGGSAGDGNFLVVDRKSYQSPLFTIGRNGLGLLALGSATAITFIYKFCHITLSGLPKFIYA